MEAIKIPYIFNDIEKKLENNNSFPIKVFPKQIQNLIINAKKTIGYNPDYLSAGILSSCATAIGSTVKIFNGTYESSPILWLTIVGGSGIGKTHPLNYAKKPIEKKDRQKYIEYKALFQDYESQEKKGTKPKYEKTLLTDFTPEKLAETLQFNEKGILIYKDELIGWINSFDQYSKGGDQQKYLELFNGGTLTVDRVSKEPIRIEETNVNIVGGIQPKKLKELAGNGRMDDGFLSRVLFVIPNNLQPNLFTGKSISEIHNEDYKRLFQNLYEVARFTIEVSEAQIKQFQNWQHEKAVAHFNDDTERTIQAKLETYVWRLALVLEMMQQATQSSFNSTLSDKCLENAITLAEYFRKNALSVFDRITANNPLEDLSINKVDLYRKLPEKFKRKDVLPLFKECKVQGGSINRFLNDKTLFKRLDSAGNYEKKHK